MPAVLAAQGVEQFRERELLKRLGITTAVAGALRSRGIGEQSATIAAQLATLTFAQTIAQ